VGSGHLQIFRLRQEDGFDGGIEEMSRRKTDSVIDRWLDQMTLAQVEKVEALPVRRDMLALLVYLRDKRVAGTQRGGNLPLKAVREITAQFVNPPVLDETVGGHVYQLRIESDIWPLYFLHILADVGGLISGGRARQMRLTEQGVKFLQAIPPVQVWYQLSTWWWQVDWLVAYQVAGMGEQMPPSFQAITMESLLKQPVGKHVDFDTFAHQLIQRTGYRWSNPDGDMADYLMRGGIRNIVIRILQRFESVELTYRENKIGSVTFQELDTFCITPFGMGLLQAVEGAR
jgi:hypothetical protein